MKRIRILLLIMLVAVALGWLWLRASGPGRSPASASQTRSIHDDPSPIRHVEPAPETNRPAYSASVAEPQRPRISAPPALLSAEEISAMNPALVALSPEEARWLYRHGYPTQDELDALPATSHDELLRRARAGDVRALVLEGLKLEMEGDLSGAFATLSVAAQRGSLYAREKLGEVTLREERLHAGSAQVGDFAQYHLYMQIAKVFGDHRVDAMIERTLPSNLSPELRRQLDESALASLPAQLQSIANDARLRGVPQPAPDPRPNVDIWAQLENGTLLEAPVYSPGTPDPGSP